MKILIKKFQIIQKLNLNLNPVLFTLNKNGFINSKYPYQAMYIMDRPLMGEYLKVMQQKLILVLAIIL